MDGSIFMKHCNALLNESVILVEKIISNEQHLVRGVVRLCTYRKHPRAELLKYKTEVYSEVAGEYKLSN